MTLLPWQQHRVLFPLLLRALQQHEEVVARLMGRKQLYHGIQTGKNNEKPRTNVTISRQRSVYMHVLVRNDTWAGPSNPRAGPRNCRAGPYRTHVSWASLPYDGPGRAGP